MVPGTGVADTTHLYTRLPLPLLRSQDAGVANRTHLHTHLPSLRSPGAGVADGRQVH